MGIPNKLEVKCDSCKVSEECPVRGSSPTMLSSGKAVCCRLVGGYGQVPIPESRMLAETKDLVRKHGPCLTIAEVPTIDDSSGILYFRIVKIWSKPKLHPRQTTSVAMDLGPSSYQRQNPKPRN